ncbi:MAG: hypothetical protein AB7K09_17490 [Planctomycetota bacterium]
MNHNLVRPALLVLPLLLVAVLASTALAGELQTPFDLPDFRADQAPTVMSTTTAPWLSQKDRYYNADVNVFWNQNFRGGIGQFRANAIEYVEYNYNNKTTTADAGKISEIHNTISLVGAPIPNLRLYVKFGVNSITIDQSTVAGSGVQCTGLTYELGTEVGFPIGPITLMGRFFWRQWETSRKGSINALATQWNGAFLVSVEPVGKRGDFTLNIYAGFGLHYNYQDWTFIGTSTDEITPDNTGTQTNGTERIDVIAGLSLAPIEWLEFHFEARFVGPLYIIGGLSVIF